MLRYLLFDGHCVECSRIASAVRGVAGGRVEPRSLHDPAMRALVERVRPHWRPEPLLLEVDGDRVRVRSGLVMRVRMLAVLGPGEAFRLARRIIEGETRARTADGIGRRTLLGRAAGAAVVGGAVLAGIGLAGGAASAKSAGGWVTDKATLDRLRRTRIAQAAGKAFGNPKWDRVYRGGPKNAPYYVLTHPGKTPTYTAIENPATAGEAARGFSYRVKSVAGLPQVDWLRPDGGAPVLHTEVDKAGVTTSRTADKRWVRMDPHGKRTGPLAEAQTAAPRTGSPTDPNAWVAFFLCIAACAGPHIPACGGFCVACGASGGQNPVACAQCAGCIAGVGLGCGMVCWNKFPIPIPSK